MSRVLDIKKASLREAFFVCIFAPYLGSYKN